MIPVLMIDDDRDLCGLLEKSLGNESMALEAVNEGSMGLDVALKGEHDIVLLDINLPGLTGFEVLRELRRRGGPPVVMLTGRDGELDKVLGLEMGADDYLTKPFSTRELAARIRAVLRRASPRPARRGPVEVSGVFVDPGRMLVRRDGEAIDVTSAEFSLLELLVRRSPEAVGREEIARHVLGKTFIPLDRSVDMHVCNLRQKLGRHPDGDEYIKTVRGTGYVFCRRSPHDA
ncbi:two component transcriptional regulator, winged helix family [Alkalidesulfovibrio alkalitolerans DSM 16529]|uniref:Two component transcriptional regulator, winged helix family n=1 Tax=Alkalidesulfovibrio alkalitolerans DSM 16529 TaxID=1121439 RepID=S7URR2_9BACT|nr:response regulator transcription factor [Alkalidesulfovibrio alkalitolerans]EPR35003.1 two component transcriptional regulator, winged helix family [Alkalidesulfovibrio alkalitolerans DSM 16529]